MNDDARVWHAGSCHCGAVRIEVRAPPGVELHDCNCSMCTRSGYLHLIVPATDFRLVAGEGDLTEYRFGTRTARHLFCRHCGVKAFYVPRSHPDGFSVNFNCLDRYTIRGFRVLPFDGQHWEAARANLDAR